MDLVAAFRSQAEACARLGSPMYADLLARVADDLDAGGPAVAALAGHEDAPGPSGVALRLAGSVHRLVLERRAGPLAAYYPSVGGTWEPDACWRAWRDLLAEQPDAVREWLDRPPQTNEVGRSAALMAGLRVLARDCPLPVRLVEIGSSGGLNLLADRFRYVTDDGRSFGPADAPVVLDPAWTGAGPRPGPDPVVAERVGSDLRPVDVRSTEGRLALTAYVWPDQVERLERLRGALALAQEVPYVVHRQGASAFLDDLDLVEGRITVLWHSAMWQYLDRGEQERVRASIDVLGGRSTEGCRFAHVFMEPTRRSADAEHEFWVVVEEWPGGERRFVARSRGHGVPTTWE